MKILWFVDKQFDRAMSRTTWLEIGKRLEKAGHQVVLLTGFKKEKVQFPDYVNQVVYYYKNISLPFFNRIYLYLIQLKQIKTMFTSYKPDIFLFNTSNYFLLNKAVKLRGSLGISTKLVYDVRTFPVHKSVFGQLVDEYLFHLCLKLTAKSFDGVTYITPEMKRVCEAISGPVLCENAIWTSGVDIKLFSPSKDTCPNSERLKVIYHGSVQDKRHIANIVKALSYPGLDKVTFTVLGSGYGIETVQKASVTCGVEDRVHVIPPVPKEQVPKIINEHHVGILPFPNLKVWATSSPIKLFEYLACAKPVIATSIAAHRDALGDGDVVFWAENSKPESLAVALREAYDNCKSLAFMGEQARKLVESKFTWDIQANKLEALLFSIL